MATDTRLRWCSLLDLNTVRMAVTAEEGKMNWLECPAIEAVPGKLSGVPIIKSSRVRPEDLVNNLDLTEEELALEFGLPLDDVHQVLRFYHEHREPAAYRS